jgi:methyl-accepting chemotaxis protein
MTMKQKMMVTMVLLVSIPMLVSVTAGTWFAKDIAGELLIEQAQKKLISIRKFRKNAVENYFSGLHKQITTMAASDSIVDATSEFGDSYFDAGKRSRVEDPEKLKQGLLSFYRNDFTKKYQESSPESNLQLDQLLSTLNENSLILQSLYISNNPNPIGEKDKMDTSKDSSSYSIWHKSYHEQFMEIQNTYGYSDIYIADPETGEIIYSVFKNVDYATSLTNGPYSKSGIGEAFRAANASADKSFTYLTDFSSYLPSYGHPEMFVSAPIYRYTTKIGVLILKLPTHKLNSILTGNNAWEEDGLGKTGEIYLVGDDKLKRTNSRLMIDSPAKYLETMREIDVDKKTLNLIQARASSLLLEKVDTVGVDRALKGESGFEVNLDYFNNRVLSAYSKLDIAGLNWVILSEMDEEEAFAPAHYLSQTLMFLSASIAGVMLGVAILLGWWITARLTDPIKLLEVAIHEIEDKSDLSRRLQSKPGDVTNGIIISLNNMLQKLHHIVEMVATTSISLASASSNIQNISNVTNEDVRKQQDETDQVRLSIEKMADTVADVAANADEANSAAKIASTQTIEGNSVVISATQSIGELANDVHQATEVITKLATKTDNIGGVLDVIRGIAEQTNLLALNAAIEAARAGEQGRGFAVVADEVRTLASRTQESTNEIQKMIEDLQTGAKDAVSVMEQGQKQAKLSVDQAGKVSGALRGITESIANITQMNERIAKASGEQRLVTDDVIKNIEGIVTISHSTTSNAEKTANASEKLGGFAKELETAVQQFKL